MSWYNTSKLVLASDDPYMKAVESKDVATAQRLVDEAALAAGYTLETEHQTVETFTVFAAGEFGFHMGKLPPGMYGNVMPLRVSLKHPLRMKDLGVWHPDVVISFLWRLDVIDDDELSDIRAQLEYGKQHFSDRLTSEHGDKDPVDHSKANYELSSIVRELIKSKGYDGIVYRNEAEGYEDSYVVFDPSQIKSAAPVTYDDGGAVIPLSARFNAGNPDIRW